MHPRGEDPANEVVGRILRGRKFLDFCHRGPLPKKPSRPLLDLLCLQLDSPLPAPEPPLGAHYIPVE